MLHHEEVWDEAYITAKEDMTLHFVIGSAKIQNDWDTNGSVLSTTIFDQEGVYLGVTELNGLVLGCYEYSGVVTYRFQTQAVDDEPKETNIYRNITIILAISLVLCLTIIASLLIKRKKR